MFLNKIAYFQRDWKEEAKALRYSKGYRALLGLVEVCLLRFHGLINFKHFRSIVNILLNLLFCIY